MKFIFAQFFILFSFVSFANANNSDIGENSLAKEIILFEANSYRVWTEFNVYVMQKDSKAEQTLFDVLAKGDQMSGAFDSEALVSSWDKYRRFAWDKHTHTEDDNYIFKDIRILQKDLLASILELKKQLNVDFLPSRDANKANALLLIEQLASEYLGISTATFGSWSFSGNEQTVQIEARSAAFERMISELNKSYSDDPAKLKAIKKLSLRWKFIKTTLLAYNERSAPFAVTRNFDYMRKQLSEI